MERSLRQASDGCPQDGQSAEAEIVSSRHFSRVGLISRPVDHKNHEIRTHRRNRIHVGRVRDGQHDCTPLRGLLVDDPETAVSDCGGLRGCAIKPGERKAASHNFGGSVKYIDRDRTNVRRVISCTEASRA